MTQQENIRQQNELYRLHHISRPTRNNNLCTGKMSPENKIDLQKYDKTVKMIKKNIKYADILIIVIHQIKQLATFNMNAIHELGEMDLRKA